MLNPERLLAEFLDLVRIPSPSGREAVVADHVAARLGALGARVERDTAGNVLGRLEGKDAPLMLTAHLDTVGPAELVVPVVRDGSIYSDGTSILGADDKSGVAVILHVIDVLVNSDTQHRPIEALFTVGEETGLRGAKAFDVARLQARMGIGLDAGGDPGTIVVQGPSQNAIRMQVHGRAAHAAVRPEDGVNAIRVAAEAIAEMPLGRIDAETTANVGVIQGGTATNVVPDHVSIRAEARSRDAERLDRQTEAMLGALERRAKAHGAAVEVEVTRSYDAFCLSEDAEVVQHVSRAMRSVGVEPMLLPTAGGSDANVFNQRGLPTVQISTGMMDVHACTEHIALRSMVTAARILLACLQC
jgi:tripeptide aminopeptidase